MNRTLFKIRVLRAFMMGGAVVVPGLPRFLELHGCSIYALELWFAAAMLLALVPSGLLADRIGERRVLIAGSSLMLSGSLCWIVAGSKPWFIAAEVLLGLGLGFMFGTDESLLHRSLAAEKRGSREGYSREWGSTVSLQLLFVAASFLLGGQLAAIDPALPFYVNCMNYAVVLITSITLVEPNADRTPTNWRSLGLALATSRGLRWTILSYALLLALLRVSFWGYDAYFSAAKAPYPHGTVMSFGALLTAVAITRAAFFRQRLGLAVYTGAVGGMLALSAMGMGLFFAPWCFALVLVQQLAFGLVQNTFGSELHHFIEPGAEGLRASIASFRQMCMLICYLGCTLLAERTLHFGVAQQFLGIGCLALLGSFLLVVSTPRIESLD